MVFNRDKPWNFDQLFFEKILTVDIVNMDKWAAVGDIIQWCNSCEIVYRKIAYHPKVDRKNMANINLKIKKAHFWIKKLPSNPMIQKNAEQDFAYRKAMRLLNDIDQELMGEMFKSGMLQPNIKKMDKDAGTEING